MRAGRGDEVASHIDVGDDGKGHAIRTRARTYLDWYRADSTIPLPRNAGAVRKGTRVLWIQATGDGPMYMRNGPIWFKDFPQHSLTLFRTVE